MKILPRSFYHRDTYLVAQELLGNLLVREYCGNMLSGIIVETEAYQADDPACHAFRGKTAANQALFGPVGHAYIYFIYGNHYCCNIVARTSECVSGGVLIRALQPREGIEVMQKARQTDIHNLTNGPGKLAQAMHITKALYGVDVTQKGPLYIVQNPNKQNLKICATTRIGISKAQEKLWRFYICDNKFVSRK